jgi:HlyD family secretion protein
LEKQYYTNRVDRLLVKEGDRVKVGQTIAILDSHDRLERTSQQQLRQAQTKLQRINSSGQQQQAAAQAVLDRINLTGKQQLTDPSTNIDARIVEVHVTLDRPSSQKAAKSTNLQVRVTILFLLGQTLREQRGFCAGRGYANANEQ